jgi:hypothetical protein
MEHGESIGEMTPLDCAAQEVTPPLTGVDQGEPTVRPQVAQHQAGQASSRSQVEVRTRTGAWYSPECLRKASGMLEVTRDWPRSEESELACLFEDRDDRCADRRVNSHGTGLS